LNLKFHHFSIIEVEIPESLAEQQQIADILDAADQELNLLRTQRQTLDQQKRGLMQRLLTGKIRVKTN
jgi:type I restriction enzyme S subunit